MTKFNRLPFCAGLAVFVLLFATHASPGSGNAARQLLRGQTPPVVASLRAIDSVPASNQLHLAIGLPVRDPVALDRLLQKIYDPASGSYHQYLTPAEFAKNFGASEADYQAVIHFAETSGLRVTGTHANHLVLDVAGSVADIEKTFQVKMRVYNHPKEKRTFYSPDAEPSVDASLALPILSISGLNNYSLPQPASVRLTPTSQPPGAPTQVGSGPGGTYMGKDFRLAYVSGTKLNGTGQSVALVEFDGYYSNDIAAYETTAGLPPVSLVNVPVDGGVSGPSANANQVIEVSLDIEMAIAMATNLSHVLVYEEPESIFNWPDMLTQIADDNLAAQISCSWFNPYSPGPDPTSEQIFQQMAAQGQSFFTASGDDDAFAGSIPFPDDSPHITIVGGTTLTNVTRSGAWSGEAAWNRGLDSSSGQYIGTAGGISLNYAIPSWQLGINSFLTDGGSTTARNIPDVALTAENIFVKYGNGFSTTVGGTSCAAPLWAGFMALVNQQAVTNGRPAVGFINPAIYEIANESIYSSAFFDITNGNNTWPSSPNAFYAGPGYDLCTGLGSPKGTGLINALVTPDPLVVVSNSGFNAIGTPAGTLNIASATYYLTNTSGSNLTWSLINNSTWLNASSSGGTLPAGASASVAVSLNTAASNLVAGTYSANLWFSNVTSKVGHARFFTLKPSDPLVLLPPTEFFLSGPPGGPFSPASQSIILTNPSASTVNWSLNNTSVWFSVSPASGSLSAGAQAGVTCTPTLAAMSLPDGNYTAVFQVTNLASQFVQVFTGVVAVGIVQNGGFETGDFTSWTLAGNTYVNGTLYNGVVGVNSLTDGSGPNFIHSGNYGAFLGDTNLATLTQTIQTVPGQNYRLSLWLVNPVAGSGQQFLVNWNTNTTGNNQIYLLNNPPVLPWTNLVFFVAATATNTTLQFGAQNPPDGFGLDDISVVSLSPPSFISQPTNLTVLSGQNAAFSATAIGYQPLSYQWLQNGTNLNNRGGISGATNNVLMFTPATITDSGQYSLVITNYYGAITSSVATLTVVIPPGIGSVSANSNGSFNLNLLGTPGYTYVLQVSTNLFAPAGWQPVATNTLDASGVWHFTDLSATNFTQQFYRLKVVQ